MEKLLYDRREAAAMLGVSVRTLDKYVETGQLEKTDVGRLVKFKRASLERFADQGAAVVTR